MRLNGLPKERNHERTPKHSPYGFAKVMKEYGSRAGIESCSSNYALPVILKTGRSFQSDQGRQRQILSFFIPVFYFTKSPIGLIRLFKSNKLKNMSKKNEIKTIDPAGNLVTMNLENGLIVHNTEEYKTGYFIQEVEAFGKRSLNRGSREPKRKSLIIGSNQGRHEVLTFAKGKYAMLSIIDIEDNENNKDYTITLLFDNEKSIDALISALEITKNSLTGGGSARFVLGTKE